MLVEPSILDALTDLVKARSPVSLAVRARSLRQRYRVTHLKPRFRGGFRGKQKGWA